MIASIQLKQKRSRHLQKLLTNKWLISEKSSPRYSTIANTMRKESANNQRLMLNKEEEEEEEELGLIDLGHTINLMPKQTGWPLGYKYNFIIMEDSKA